MKTKQQILKDYYEVKEEFMDFLRKDCEYKYEFEGESELTDYHFGIEWGFEFVDTNEGYISLHFYNGDCVAFYPHNLPIAMEFFGQLFTYHDILDMRKEEYIQYLRGMKINKIN